MTYEVSYNFPVNSSNVVRRNVIANSIEQALQVSGVINPTLKATRFFSEEEKKENALHLTITPVSKEDEEITRIDYDREIQSERNGHTAEWDDCKHNTSRVGDLFAFAHKALNRVEIRRIIGTQSAATRNQNWNIEEQIGRA